MLTVTRHPVLQRLDCAAEVDVLFEEVATARAADGPEFDVILGFDVLTENTPTIELHHHFADGERSRCAEYLLTAVSRLPSFASKRCAVLSVASTLQYQFTIINFTNLYMKIIDLRNFQFFN